LQLPGHGLGLFQALLEAQRLFDGKIQFRQDDDSLVYFDDVPYVTTTTSIVVPSGRFKF
jgi:hypothetical protein